MPKDVFGRDHAFLPRVELLTFEEIARVVRILADLGLRKVRLTGGEPLLRRDLPVLVGMLAATADLDLTLTTNGAALDRFAAPLARAGLRRATVSLDALDDAIFRAMNDVDFPVARVLAGIDAAAAAGLAPLKVNAVVRRGMNDRDLVPLAARFRGTGHEMRFIEYMDVGATNGWRMDDVVAAADIVRRIDAEFPLATMEPNYTGEVAERWRYADDGKLYTCLFGTPGFDLRRLLRGGGDADLIARAIGAVWRQRDDRYSELRTRDTKRLPKVEMSYIGG
jgi:cyclic pyranopterin phosphate synthase